MRKWLVWACLVAACGDCESVSPQDEPVVVSLDAGTIDLGANDAEGVNDTGTDAPGDTSASDAEEDLGATASDGGKADAGDDASNTDAGDPTCGDGRVAATEVCDDGNTNDGDYCGADCQAVTGRCGDGLRQANETCDDAATTDCVATHDGGDGACVPAGTCNAGFSLQGGDCVPSNTTGLSRPCSLGEGYTLFKFHYDNGSTSARVDVWDASCSYSFAPGSACNVVEVYPGFGSVSRTADGYPIVTSTHYIRVRFSANGLNFSQATLYVQGRSYSTGASTQIRAWSPLYGDQFGGPVDNDFVYDWYMLDWSSYLDPSDPPSLTAVQLYAHQGSSSLAVKGMEMCVK